MDYSGDQYVTAEEAEARARELGCSGTHTHVIDGVTYYMPCANMTEYESLGGEQTCKQLTDSAISKANSVPKACGWSDDELAFTWWADNSLPWSVLSELAGDDFDWSSEPAGDWNYYWKCYWTRKAQLGSDIPANLPEWAKPNGESLTIDEAREWQLKWFKNAQELVTYWKALGCPPSGSLAATLLAHGVNIEREVSADIVLKGARHGGLSFGEGDSGEGVFQTHERGLSESQAKNLGGMTFGWDPVAISGDHLSRLQKLHDGDWLGGYEEAKQPGGTSKALARLVKEARKSVETELDNRALDLVEPISVHTDMRLWRTSPTEDTYWEGGEMFSPGNQFRENKLRMVAENKLDNKKILSNFKVSRVGEGEPKLTQSTGEEIIRGSLADLTVGEEPKIYEPGSAGSTSKAWSRLKRIQKFKWKAGTQDPYYKEFFLSDAGVLNGRWIFQYAPTSDGRQWMMSKPKDQKSFGVEEEEITNPMSVQIAKAEEVGDDQIVVGPVLIPDKVDGQGDIIGAPAIQQTAYDFLSQFNSYTKLGIQHKMFPSSLKLLESWILKEDWTVGGRTFTKGSWFLTTKVLDNNLWKKIKSGLVTGYSIGGLGSGRQLNAEDNP